MAPRSSSPTTWNEFLPISIVLGMGFATGGMGIRFKLHGNNFDPPISPNGMVRPCSCPASDESGKGLQRQRSAPCPRASTAKSPCRRPKSNKFDPAVGTKLANLQRDANHYSWRGLMSEFAIGQKIVCVRDDWKNSVFGSSVRETGERHPVKDGVYTVIGHDWL